MSKNRNRSNDEWFQDEEYARKNSAHAVKTREHERQKKERDKARAQARKDKWLASADSIERDEDEN